MRCHRSKPPPLTLGRQERRPLPSPPKGRGRGEPCPPAAVPRASSCRGFRLVTGAPGRRRRGPGSRASCARPGMQAGKGALIWRRSACCTNTRTSDLVPAAPVKLPQPAPSAAPSTCFPGRSAAARRAGAASVAGSAPLPTAHFTTPYSPLTYSPLTTCHSPNLSTLPARMRYCPRSASSRACFEGVLVRRRNRTVRESLRSRAAHSGRAPRSPVARPGAA